MTKHKQTILCSVGVGVVSAGFSWYLSSTPVVHQYNGFTTIINENVQLSSSGVSKNLFGDISGVTRKSDLRYYAENYYRHDNPKCLQIDNSEVSFYDKNGSSRVEKKNYLL